MVKAVKNTNKIFKNTPDVIQIKLIPWSFQRLSQNCFIKLFLNIDVGNQFCYKT